MKVSTKIITVLLSMSILAGCTTSTEKTKTGAVTGGILGAVVGGVIGHQSGRGLEGAAIGGGLGAIGGGTLGSAQDEKSEKEGR